MATNISQFASHGLDAVNIAVRGSTGYMAGFAGLTPLNVGIGSGMRRMRGARTFPTPLPPSTTIPIRGDNEVIAHFSREGEDSNEASIEMSVTDANIENFLTGATTKTVGEWVFFIRGAGAPVKRDVMLLMHRLNSSTEPASFEASGWENMITFNATLGVSGDDQAADNEEGSSTYSAAFKRSLVTPWVEPIASAFVRSNAYYLSWSSEFPAMLHCKIGDAASTTIVTDYAPISISKTQVWNATTGTLLTVASVTPATKTITLSAPPASGAVLVAMYEFPGY